MAKGLPSLGLAPRRLVQLTEDQEAWVEAQPGGGSAVLRGLVDEAMAGALEPVEPTVRRALVAALELLDERGSWTRGSPGELLSDLRIGETTALELVQATIDRMREKN